MQRVRYFWRRISFTLCLCNEHNISPKYWFNNVVLKLYLIELRKNCKTDACLLNGEMIDSIFDSSLLPCSCSYQWCNNEKTSCWEAWACVSPSECSALKGEWVEYIINFHEKIIIFNLLRKSWYNSQGCLQFRYSTVEK